MKHFFPPVLCGVNIGLNLGLAISRPGWLHLIYAVIVLLWSGIAYSYAKSGLSSIKADLAAQTYVESLLKRISGPK